MPPPTAGLAPLAQLGAAIRAVSEAASQDPTAVLDELARQAEALLGCDGASIHLAIPSDGDEVVFRRVRLSPFGRSRGVEASSTWRADDAVLSALRAGRVAFHEDFPASAAHDATDRPWLRDIASALYAPLVAADEPLGVLFAAWASPRVPNPELLLLADALARCAGVAVHQARLLERAAHAHAELSAVFDAAEDSIIVFDECGRLTHANRHARARIRATLGTFPADAVAIAAWADSARMTGIDPTAVVAAAQRGESSSAAGEYLDADGAVQRVHVQAAPIRDGDEPIRGVVVVTRNITKLHDAIAESARLDGAIKTARLVAHQLNNQLSPVRGYSELLAEMISDEVPRMFAERVLRATDAASATVARLQRIIRFEETESGGYAMLDLEAAAPPGQA